MQGWGLELDLKFEMKMYFSQTIPLVFFLFVLIFLWMCLIFPPVSSQFTGLPFGFFFWNWDTLDVKPKAKGVDTRQELLKFYEEKYSANLMHLVVYSKENLDKIQSLVEDKFQEIRNSDRSRFQFPGQPCTSEHLQILVRAVPIKQGHKLRIVWPITPSILHYKEGPCRYLGHLIGHEGEGSLFYVLKKLGWAAGLSAGEGEWTSEFSFFKVVIDLTDAGQDLQDVHRRFPPSVLVTVSPPDLASSCDQNPPILVSHHGAPTPVSAQAISSCNSSGRCSLWEQQQIWFFLIRVSKNGLRPRFRPRYSGFAAVRVTSDSRNSVRDDRNSARDSRNHTLSREAGWTVELDCTTYRHSPTHHNQQNLRAVSARSGESPLSTNSLKKCSAKRTLDCQPPVVRINDSGMSPSQGGNYRIEKLSLVEATPALSAAEVDHHGTKKGNKHCEVEGVVDEHKLQVLSNCLVGWCKNFIKIGNLANQIQSKGLAGFTLMRAGGNVVMVFEDSDSLKNDKLETLAEWFSRVETWSESLVVECRRVWVVCEGIPFHAWNGDTFKNIATKWGKLIAIDSSCEFPTSFDRAKIQYSLRLKGELMSCWG
ncbi:hypothetical protein F3Y22_tig00001290pilonHSYRG00001 [Hibiscus syriacus]|uniref:DUF4283 domain-containing protein n=1 Tax=Hibiscus syriacus TaxID=106335 RepID=A0A6A3CVS9_HIBSY|nr:hypothetical protein F3Y22_tig00001290pilonHSYRG00001 [Hibiscus syriacus]